MKGGCVPGTAIRIVFENLVRKGVTVQSTSVCILPTAWDKEFFHGKYQTHSAWQEVPKTCTIKPHGGYRDGAKHAWLSKGRPYVED